MMTKKISSPIRTTLLPNKVIKLCDLDHESKQLSFRDCKECSLVISKGGKGFLVMHANSAVYSLLSLLSNITLLLFYLFFHFQLTIQISFICFSLISMLFLLCSRPSHIHGYSSFYTQDQAQVVFLLYPCFHQPLNKSTRSANRYFTSANWHMSQSMSFFFFFFFAI